MSVEPLLVFSRAWVDRPLARRKGVRVLPARMLIAHLRKRKEVLSPAEVEQAHERLRQALLDRESSERVVRGRRGAARWHTARHGRRAPRVACRMAAAFRRPRRREVERDAAGRARARAAASLPPGPRAPALVQTLAWAVAPTWVMDRCARRLGEAFTLTFSPSGMKLVMVSDPEAVKTVFTAPPEVAPSAAGNSPVRAGHGAELGDRADGPEHMRQRKLLLPPFHGERMREYEEVIVQATGGTWRAGRWARRCACRSARGRSRWR